MTQHSLTFSALVILAAALPARATSGYKVNDSPEGLELVTPYGTKTIVGDYAPDGSQNYRIEIPLDEIKPSPTPVPTPLPLAAATPSPSPEPVQVNVYNDEKKEADKKDSEKREPASLEPEKPTLVEVDDTDTLVMEANRLFNRGRYYEAALVVDDILRKNPTFIRGWIMKGSLLHVEGEKDLAKKAWEKAKELDPKNPKIEAILERYR